MGLGRLPFCSSASKSRACLRGGYVDAVETGVPAEAIIHCRIDVAQAVEMQSHDNVPLFIFTR